MADTLLVTGASGFLGATLCARAAAAGWAVAGTHHRHAPAGVDSTALDVRDADAVDALVQRLRPAAVVHTAYVQDVDGAWATNVDGAAHVAAAAARTGARLVHLSSDVVFAGDGDRPLVEDDHPAPVSAYGASKAAGEEAVSRAHPGASIVRTSLIYGGPGHAPSKHELLAVAAARGERDVVFFSDELRNPVQVTDLAGALLELARLDVAGPLHVAGAETVDRHAFACLCARAAGVPTAGLRHGAAPPGRPRNAALDVSRAQALLRTRLRGVHEVLA
ncbi:MAG TPA: sugar nucleotide-binding protein [Baekduia sp.]|nr:sugar nucleotide-binding protein [Baekduia sp.]